MNTDKTYAEKIASEYAPKETRKVVALKKLDNRAKLPANIFAYTFGVVMALLLGVGMCLSMKVIGDGSEFDKIILVTPIYSFGMPSFVYDIIPRLNRKTDVFIIQNYGGMVGGADCFIYEYAKEHGLNVKAIYTVKMPENFTLTFTVPKIYIKLTLKSANKRIDKVLDCICSGVSKIPKKRKTKSDVYFKNKSNWHIIGERFSVTDNCVKCGKCVLICPTGNITLNGGKIVFADKCVACLGCYHRCPKKAIVYKNKRKKDRYINPNVNENDIGKDF